ncbi:MAG: HlyC/CorC family transporter [Ignavibacteria bacterium]|nr:MAG: HlyC/CorC family transporter [Ignavibacteria bacterium]
MENSLDLVGLIFLVLLSAFFSSTELAFVVTNKIKIEIWARKNNSAAKQVNYFVNKPNNFFSTILIGNNIVNIAFASLSTVVLTSLYQLNDFWILIITTFILLLFGELIPKYLAREYSDRFIMFAIFPIRLLHFLLYPFVLITSGFSGWITKTGNLREENYLNLVAKEDIQELLSESSKAGKVTEEESEVINKIIDLGDQKINEVMTPRTDIVGVDVSSSIEEVLDIFIESGYSKLPVYKENLDNIQGVVFAYDMFKKPESLQEMIREVIFVPETKKSLDMLNEFLDKRISLAIVVDEFGGTAGLVTLEDVIEEMFGEIQDEYDEEEVVCKKISQNEFIISGKYEIDKLNEEFDLGIPEGEYETLAGYITTEIGRIPQRGEQLELGNHKIVIVHSDKTKINLVKLFINTLNEKGT